MFAIGIRDDETRANLHENFVAPFTTRSSISDSNHDNALPSDDNSEEYFEVDKVPKWKFQNYKLENWEKWKDIPFNLKEGEDTSRYFRPLLDGQDPDGGPKSCFIPGTDWDSTVVSSKCVCVNDYYGEDCGIPGAVWFSHYKESKKDRSLLRARSHARRLIHGVLVNHEYDLLEARVNMLKDVVDMYVIQESNFTTFGTSKPLHFLEKFRHGWLSEFQEQMAYLFLPSFNERCEDNGWCADAEIRRYLGKNTLRLVNSTVKEDDIFLLLDADELPLPEVLLFLKLYNGYGEPIRFGFKWTVYGFYWLKAEDKNELEDIPLLGSLFKKEPTEKLLQLWVASTIGMLRDVYVGNGMLLRRNVWDNKALAERKKNYKLKAQPNGTFRNPVFRGGYTVPFHEWDLGSKGHYAGYHCSWCYDPEGIRTKLLSAQKHDKPRWGDYPEKTDVNYIAKLIRTGGWFDDTRPFIENHPDKHPNNYAPKYILDHKDQFKYLLDPPVKLASDLNQQDEKPKEYDEDLLNESEDI